nr:MAG TPA: hypothetical protein [Caudoviricetes sp.]
MVRVLLTASNTVSIAITFHLKTGRTLSAYTVCKHNR